MKTAYQKNNFIIVPSKGVLRGKKSYIQVVYMWLCVYADSDTGECYPSISKLTKDTALSKSSVIRAIKDLEELKLVSKVNRFKGNEKTTNLYTVYTLSLDVASVSVTQPPSVSVTPPSVSVTHRTQPLNSTNYINSTSITITSFIKDFIEYFNLKANTNFRVTKQKEDKIKTRLKTFTYAEIRTATDNMLADPFYLGKNDRNWRASPDFLIKSDDQIERFLNHHFMDKSKKPEEAFDVVLPGEFLN